MSYTRYELLLKYEQRERQLIGLPLFTYLSIVVTAIKARFKCPFCYQNTFRYLNKFLFFIPDDLYVLLQPRQTYLSV